MIAVLGASGFIGSFFIEELISQKKEPLAIDIVKPKGNYNWLIANITEPATLERVFFEYSVDTVVHLVGLPQINLCEKDPHFSYLLNTQSVYNTLEAMRKTDVQKIIFASSAAVYKQQKKAAPEQEQPAPSTMYGYHKYISEELIKAYSNSYNINFTILRLFNVYGQNPQIGKDAISIFLRRAKKGEPLIVKGKAKYRDFVHVKDVAKAFTASLSEYVDNRIINVGTGVKVSLGELADMIKEIFPKIKVKYQRVVDDGTGLIADTMLCQRLLNFTPINPHDGIRKHIRRYSA